MSRSYKHSPYCTDSHLHNTMKRYANKKVRHTEGDFKGGAYKKLFCSYDISDYAFRETYREAVDKWELAQEGSEYYAWILKYYSTFEDYINNWRKYYYSK